MWDSFPMKLLCSLLWLEKQFWKWRHSRRVFICLCSMLYDGKKRGRSKASFRLMWLLFQVYSEGGESRVLQTNECWKRIGCYRCLYFYFYFLSWIHTFPCGFSWHFEMRSQQSFILIPMPSIGPSDASENRHWTSTHHITMAYLCTCTAACALKCIGSLKETLSIT